MSENQELFEQLRLLTKQMNIFLSSSKSGSDKKLSDAHEKAKGIVNGKSDKEGEYQEGSVETNRYLKELVDLNNKERDERKKAKLNLSASDVLSSPTESIKKLLSPSAITGSLSAMGSSLNNATPGRTVSGTIGSLALKTPGAIFNTIQDAIGTRKAKKTEKLRREVSSEKQVLDIKNKKLSELDKTDKNNKPIIAKLEADINNLKKSISAKGSSLSNRITDDLFKSQEKKLSKSLSKDDKGLIKQNLNDNIKKSLIGNLGDNIGNNKKTNYERRGLLNISDKSSVSKSTISGKGTPVGNMFQYKIPISGNKPTTFGETIGGIYYNLVKLADNNTGTKKEDSSSGLMGLIGGGLMALFTAFKSKLFPILGLFKGVFNLMKAMLPSFKSLLTLSKSLLGNIGKLLPSLSKSFPTFLKAVDKLKGLVSPLLKKILPKATPVVTKGLMSAAVGTVAKTAAKKIPIAGALLAGTLGAVSTEGSTGRKTASGVGTGVGSLGGTLAGAATGAAIGSVVPLVGTAIGGIAGAIIGSIAGEKLGKNIGTGLFDMFSKKDPIDNNRTKANNILTTEKEVKRASDISTEIKIQEQAMYNALKRHGNEDMDVNGRKRAALSASALMDEANR